MRMSSIVGQTFQPGMGQTCLSAVVGQAFQPDSEPHISEARLLLVESTSVLAGRTACPTFCGMPHCQAGKPYLRLASSASEQFWCKRILGGVSTVVVLFAGHDLIPFFHVAGDDLGRVAVGGADL